MATLSSVAMVGATPVFADIEPRTFCISPEAVEDQLSTRTAAVMNRLKQAEPASHIFFSLGELEPILESSRAFALLVTESNEQARISSGGV